MSSKEYFNRKYELSIKGGGISVVVSNIEVKFKVDYCTKGGFNNANITMEGLSKVHRGQLEKFTVLGPWQVREQEIKVELKAGYEKKTFAIFKGVLESVSITAPPSLGVSINAWGIRSVLELETKSTTIEAELPVVNAAASVLRKYGCTFKDQSKGAATNQKLSHVTISGTLLEVIGTISSWCPGWRLVHNYGQVIALPILDKGDKKYTISKTNGLLAVSNVDYYGANIQTWMNDFTTVVGTTVDLKSELNNSASGEYDIYELSYIGDYRGREWYARLTGRRLT